MSSRRLFTKDHLVGLLPNRSDYRGLSHSWRADLLAGLTVGVVALPLALGFGVASGVGPTAGIFTAIVAGIVAAVFGGSSVQVSGPTGAMAVVLLPIVARYGVGAVETVAVIAGILVLAFSIFGLGRVIQFVPWSVLEGFTFGIAVVIVLQQVPLVLGLSKGTGRSVLDSAWLALCHAIHQPPTATLLVALSVMVIMALLPTWTTRVPSSIVAVIVVTATVVVFKVHVVTLSSLPSHLPAPRFPDLAPSQVRPLLAPALAVALLAAIESLLSARVANAMMGRTKWSENREMLGQGLANIACGLFGGMPATGAIARTAVNVRSGARSRVSAIIHSLVIVVVVLVATPLVTKIPLAVLGGVLIVTAYRMVDRKRIIRVLRTHTTETAVFALTALTTVLVDLVTAIEVGLGVAGLLALRSLASKSGVTQEKLADISDEEGEDAALVAEHIAIFRFDGALFFGAAPYFLESFSELSGASVVILRLAGLSFIDASGTQVLAEIIDDLHARDITVLVKATPRDRDRLLASSPLLGELDAKGHLYSNLELAITHARLHIHGHGKRSETR